MTPWDWLAPSTASRARVSYTGRLQRQNGAILDGHLGGGARSGSGQIRSIALDAAGTWSELTSASAPAKPRWMPGAEPEAQMHKVYLIRSALD